MALRIDDPDELHAGKEPLGNLRKNLTRPVIGRQDLSHEVGRDRGISAALNGRKTFRADERQVRRANSIGIGRDLEAGVLAEHGAESLGLHELSDEKEQTGLNPSVIRAGRLADDQLPAHKLRGLTRNVDSFEFFRGHGVRHDRSCGDAE